METISELRDRIVTIYTRLEAYINPVLKFLLMFITLLIINGKLGYMSKLNNIVIVFGVSLIAAFLPMNAMVIFSALFIMAHLYKLSIQVAAVIGLVFVIMIVLYFRFSPKEAIATMLTPILFMIKLPYLAVLMVGLFGGPLAFISVGCGTVVYYIVKFISDNSDKFSSSFSVESALSGFKVIIDDVLNNDTMIVMVISLSIIAILVNVIKRLSFDYSWYVAIAVGSIVGLIVVIIGSSAMDADVSIAGALFSMLISAVLATLVALFLHNVDYSRAEYVQFEDDDYFYYVKAIPRVTVRRASSERRRSSRRREEYYEDEEDFD